VELGTGIYSLFRINWPVADGLLLVLHHSVEKNSIQFTSVSQFFDSIQFRNFKQAASGSEADQTDHGSAVVSHSQSEIVQSQRGTYTNS